VSIVIVYGPQGIGKTTHGEALRRYYKCSRLVEWEGEPLREGDLALTNELPPYNVPGATAVPFETAKRALGLP